MTDSRIFRLVSAEARRRAAACCMESPDGWLVRFGLPPKSRDQENLAHAVYEAFARTHPDIDAEGWKRRLKLEFYDETGAEYPELWAKCKPILTPVPGTRYVIATEIASRSFPRELYRLFIEFLHERAAHHEVNLGTRENATAA